MKLDRLENTSSFFFTLSILCTLLCFLYVPAAMAQLADSPWPSFQNGIRNTGLSEHAGVEHDSVIWEFSKFHLNIYAAPVIGPDGTIYIGGTIEEKSRRHQLIALNPNGTQKWNFEVAAPVSSTPTIAADSTIYFITDQGYLYAVAPDGSKKWQFNGAGEDSWSVIDTSGTIYVRGYQGLYALNSSGEQKWLFEISGYTNSSPSIGKNGTVYVGSENSLYAINPDGSQKWRYKIGSYITSTPAIGKDGSIYVGSTDSSIYAINPDGSLQWNYNTTDRITTSPALGPDGTIYASQAGEGGALYAINPDGSKKWRLDLPPMGSPPVVDANGMIYTGSTNGYLYATRQERKHAWRFGNGGDGASSVAINSKGIVYAHVDDTVYAIGDKKATGISDESGDPIEYRLRSAFPNPFNPSTNIRFSLPQSKQVTINVFNTIGQKIETLVNRQMTAGSHSVTFNAEGLPSGVYIYRLKAGGFSKSRKMLLVK